jgi:L-amino acid N-acyltransferase YncA
VGTATRHTDAASVMRSHERHGFARVGHLREAGHKHGAWHDVSFWQYQLGND